MTRIEYQTINKKVYHYEPTEAEQEEIDARRSKLRYALLKEERRKNEEHVLQHSKGYCTKCFMLRPLTGICPTCN